MPTTTVPNSEIAIWRRILDPTNNGLSSSAARCFLRLTFSDWDKARMNELAQRNQEGLLTEQERRELQDYVIVGDVLSLIHLKAKRSLKP